MAETSPGASLIMRRHYANVKKVQIRRAVRDFAKRTANANTFGQVVTDWQDTVDELVHANVLDYRTGQRLLESKRPWTMYQAELAGDPVKLKTKLAFADQIANDAGTIEAAERHIKASRADPDVTGQRWVAHHDNRTRATHMAADGQTVKVGMTFRVGGFPLRYPGDPEGPIQEIINCRCVLVAVEA